MAINFFQAKPKKRKVLSSEINKSQIVKVLDQTGKTNISRDKVRDALLPGKRTSKTGKTYWETRRNRSDKSAVTKL